MLASLPLNIRRVPKLSVGAAVTGARKLPCHSGSCGACRKHLRLELGFRLDPLQLLRIGLHKLRRHSQRSGAVVRRMNLNRAAQIPNAARPSSFTSIRSFEGPTAASTSTPASANHPCPSRPGKNSSCVSHPIPIEFCRSRRLHMNQHRRPGGDQSRRECDSQLLRTNMCSTHIRNSQRNSERKIRTPNAVFEKAELSQAKRQSQPAIDSTSYCSLPGRGCAAFHAASRS